jgi:Anti-sigma-28 factor, FlgM
MVQGLQTAIAHGRYVVDPEAVAESMLARSRIGISSSDVLVAPETPECTPFRVHESDPASGEDRS